MLFEQTSHYIQTKLLKFFKTINNGWTPASMLPQVICHCERKNHPDIHRFEKISNIIKQFKISCSKVTASFNSIEVRNSKFAAYIESFTPNTYVMVVTSDPEISQCSWSGRLSFCNYFNSGLVANLFIYLIYLLSNFI